MGINGYCHHSAQNNCRCRDSMEDEARSEKRETEEGNRVGQHVEEEDAKEE